MREPVDLLGLPMPALGAWLDELGVGAVQAPRIFRGLHRDRRALGAIPDLGRHAAVVEAEVVGVPDAEWGELVTAVVEARDPVTLAGLRDLVEPRAWAPRRLVVVAELPRLANGKPDRLAVRALAAREVATRG